MTPVDGFRAWIRRLGASRGARTATKGDGVDWLIVGLGNPGPRYESTRHNVGRDALRLWAERLGTTLNTAKFDALVAPVRIGESKLILAIPLKYMNESGHAVAQIARFYRVPPEQVLMVFDDLDLPLGRLRLRTEGGSGGNRGAASVIRSLGSQAVPRLRIGIGRPPPEWDPADYVLSRFTADERAIVDGALERAVAGLELLVRQGVGTAMNSLNST